MHQFLEIALCFFIVAFIVWGLLQIQFMAPFKNLLIGVAIFFLVIYTIHVLGIFTGEFTNIRVGDR